MSKKALLVVSFGTSYIDNIDKTIKNIEDTINQKYNDYTVFRAFTSEIVISKLISNGYDIKNVKNMMNYILELGFDECYIQPTHIIAGHEYEKTVETIKEFENKFSVIKMGKPLLYSPEDLEDTVDALYRNVSFDTDEAVVFMGHGSDHLSNKVYKELQYCFKNKNHNNFFVGTVEANPNASEVYKSLKESGYKKAVLLPLLVVAGDHALNDMSGNESYSWISIFNSVGIKSRAIIRGIGEYKEIADLYCDHIKKYMGI